MTPSKVNAVRAALKAGVKTSQIAPQFGLSHADVQGVLARE
jgi:transposase-like protein